MSSFEYYKKRVTQATEEVFSAEKESERSFSENISVIADTSESKYKKLVAFMDIAKSVVPESLQKRYKESLYDTSDLPFDIENFPFEGRLDGGAESNVYLFSSKKEGVPSFVFKVDYRDSGNVALLQKVAHERKEEYERIKGIFGEMPELIPEEHIIVTNGVRRDDKTGIVASIQTFVGRNIRDVFRIPQERIKELCAVNPKLCADIKKFAEINKRLFEERGEIVDIQGANAVIAENEDGAKLYFIDPHNTFYADSEKTNPDIFQKLEERLKRLIRIAEEI